MQIDVVCALAEIVSLARPSSRDKPRMFDVFDVNGSPPDDGKDFVMFSAPTRGLRLPKRPRHSKSALWMVKEAGLKVSGRLSVHGTSSQL